jgi:hypothetical protein
LIRIGGMIGVGIILLGVPLHYWLRSQPRLTSR